LSFNKYTWPNVTLYCLYAAQYETIRESPLCDSENDYILFHRKCHPKDTEGSGHTMLIFGWPCVLKILKK